MTIPRVAKRIAYVASVIVLPWWISVPSVTDYPVSHEQVLSAVAK